MIIYFTQIITAWALDAGGLGHKCPRPGFARKSYCPPCSRFLTESHLLSHAHLLLHCKVMNGVREAQGITDFVQACR